MIIISMPAAAHQCHPGVIILTSGTK